MASFGMPLDDWQDQVLQSAMGERPDGKWAARQVGLSAPRQNGKSQLIVARVMAGLLLFAEQMIIVSAHRLDTAREIFIRLVQLIEDSPALESRVDFIGRSEMREYIRMKSGQTVRFKARGKGGSGRGFSCDCLLLDEAQMLGAAAWSDILPTMSARPNPQVWLMGTPPTEVDDSEVFGRFRDAGIAGKTARMAYLEWSAEPDDDIDDPAVWAKANPGFPFRISLDAIASERAVMSDDQFAMERLGMWSAGRTGGVIPQTDWAHQEDVASVAIDHLALGIEVGPNLSWASISLAGRRADGDWHVELLYDQNINGRGTEWLLRDLRNILTKNPLIRAVVVDVTSPIAEFIEKRGNHYYWKDTKIRVHAVRVQELGIGCTKVLSSVVTGSLWHLGQPQLSSAALVAGKRPLGDTGMWVWSRKSSESDITPVQAMTYALIGAQSERPTKPGNTTVGRSQSSRRKAVVI